MDPVDPDPDSDLQHCLKHENSGLFLFLWVIFALLDPDPATQINADPEP